MISAEQFLDEARRWTASGTREDLQNRDGGPHMSIHTRSGDGWLIRLPCRLASRKRSNDDLPGFGARLQGDSTRFIVQYKIGAKHRRMTLGSTATVTLDSARKSAGDILAAVRLGHDPAGDKAEARLRVKGYVANAREASSHPPTTAIRSSNWLEGRGHVAARFHRRIRRNHRSIPARARQGRCRWSAN